MRRLTPLLPVVLAAALAAAAPSPVSAAPRQVASEPHPFTADARGSTYAWSTWVAAAKEYRLRLSIAGRIVDPAVPGRQKPFDVDLGPLPGGRGTGAVYSRCADPVATRGCDVYLLDLGTGVERRLDGGVSTPSGSERRPSLDGDRVAFTRTVRGHTRIYTGPTVGTGDVEVAAMPRTGRVDELELAHGQLLSVWQDSRDVEFGRSSLYRTRGDQAVRMFTTLSTGFNESRLHSPAFAGGRVTFGERNVGANFGNRVYRSTLGGRNLKEARGSDVWAQALPAGGGRFLVNVSYEDSHTCMGYGPVDEDARCTLTLTDPLVWRQATRQP